MKIDAGVQCVNVVNQITNKHFIALNKRTQIDGRVDRLIDRTVCFPVPLIKWSSLLQNIGQFFIKKMEIYSFM